MFVCCGSQIASQDSVCVAPEKPIYSLPFVLSESMFHTTRAMYQEPTTRRSLRGSANKYSHKVETFSARTSRVEQGYIEREVIIHRVQITQLDLL